MPVLLLMASMAVPSARGLDPRVGDERFTEGGFGFSIPVPVDGRFDSHPIDDSVAAWDLGDRASLRLRVLRSEMSIADLEAILDLTWRKTAYGLTTARPTALEIEMRRIAERPGLLHSARLEPEAPRYLDERRRAEFDSRPLFYGQALIKLGPNSVASIEIYAPHEHAVEARELLFVVADGAALTPPPVLHDRRQAAFSAAEAWLAATDFVALARQAAADRWFELRRKGELIGYARERWWTETSDVAKRDVALPEPGFVTGRYTSTHRENTRLTTRHDAYFSQSVNKEVWSYVSDLTRTRVQGGGVFEDQRVTSRWTETAVRNDDEISLIFETPPDAATVRDVFEGEWVRAMQEIEQGRGPGMMNRNVLESQTRTAFVEIPNRLPPSLIDGEDAIPPTNLYLNQAALPLVPAALAKAENGVFAFYAYNSEAGRLTMRQYTVQRGPRGGTTVTEQPTPWSPITTHRYDARGNLLERVLPGGTVWVPATKDELADRFAELR
ncbi:MAG: hypothetical protein AAF663_06340 [Planctomycetota bacterium]